MSLLFLKTRVFAFLFAGLVLISTSGCKEFWQIVDKPFVDEYNQRLSRANELMAEHDSLVELINEASGKDPEKSYSYARQYVAHINNWRNEMGEFKTFLETNNERISRLGVNPSYVRDNTTNAMKLFNDNEISFRKGLNAYDAMKEFQNNMNQMRQQYGY